MSADTLERDFTVTDSLGTARSKPPTCNCGSTSCEICLSKPTTPPRSDWQPQFSPWRHGGWYVDNLQYPSGAVGCVSRNYPDKKWRIACDPRPFDEQPTFPNRIAAAFGERELIAELSKQPTTRAAAATERPWEVKGLTIVGYPESDIGVARMLDHVGQPAKANAAFIVRAVNSFDAREMALLQAQTIIRDHVNGIERTAWPEVLAAIDAALDGTTIAQPTTAAAFDALREALRGLRDETLKHFSVEHQNHGQREIAQALDAADAALAVAEGEAK